MKVHLAPPSNLSQAMFRVARNLARNAPHGVQLVRTEQEADLVVHHVIGSDVLTHPVDRPYATIQYCFATAGGSLTEWQSYWSSAELVWSYYELSQFMPGRVNFYHAPLGVERIFTDSFAERTRDRVVTSGYVAGPGAEAIEEFARAAEIVGFSTTHIGPMPIGFVHPPPEKMEILFDITDLRLADVYQQAVWVSGLRHVEGFELPALEGLLCGARPILFDRPDMREWYHGHGVFVKEQSGQKLVDELVEVMSKPSLPLTSQERQKLLERFNWPFIAEGFWSRLLHLTPRSLTSACDTGADIPGGGAS